MHSANLGLHSRNVCRRIENTDLIRIARRFDQKALANAFQVLDAAGFHPVGCTSPPSNGLIDWEIKNDRQTRNEPARRETTYAPQVF